MGRLISLYKNTSPGIRASFWFLFASLFQKGLAFIITPLYTRLLTTDEFGFYSVYNSWLSIFTIFATLNLSAGVLNNALLNEERFGADDDQVLSNFQFLEIITTVIMFGITLALKFSGLLNLEFPVLSMMFLTILFTSSISLWSIKQKYRFKYRAVVIVSLVSAVVTVGCNVLFIMYGTEKSYSLVYGTTLSAAVCYVFLIVRNIVKGRSVFNFKLWKYAVVFNLPLIPHYLASIVLSTSDRIMIEYFLSNSEAALYSVAYSIGSVAFIMVNAINASLAPYTYQRIRDNNTGGINRYVRWVFAIFILTASILILLGPEFMLLMGGEPYADAKWVIPPVAATIMFYFMYPLFTNVEFYYEKRMLTMISSVVAAAANVALNYIFIPMYGYVAASFTTLLCYALLSLTHYLAYRVIVRQKKIARIYKGADLLFFTLLTIAVVAGSFFLYLNDIVRYVALGAAGILFVVAAVFGIKKMKEMLRKPKEPSEPAPVPENSSVTEENGSDGE